MSFLLRAERENAPAVVLFAGLFPNLFRYLTGRPREVSIPDIVTYVLQVLIEDETKTVKQDVPSPSTQPSEVKVECLSTDEPQSRHAESASKSQHPHPYRVQKRALTLSLRLAESESYGKC